MSKSSSTAQPTVRILARGDSALPADVNDILRFNLSNVNVSIANSIRRVILSDIDTVVFKTSPHAENDATIFINTTRINNELLCQRLSCIPVHLPPILDEIKNLILEVDVDNDSDTTILVTTEHFKIKDAVTNKYLSAADTTLIFPPNSLTGDFIEFVRLRPKMSDAITGEHIKLECPFSIWSADNDSMFNVAATCTYGRTQHVDNAKIAYAQQMAETEKMTDLTEEEKRIRLKNWQILDGKRIVVPDSFDFMIESIGVFSNEELVEKACDVLAAKLSAMRGVIESGDMKITDSLTTMSNSFDIALENEGHTLGKILEFMMFSKFYRQNKLLSFCGFQLAHPHDPDSIIRVAYLDATTPTVAAGHMVECVDDLLGIYAKIKADVRGVSAQR